MISDIFSHKIHASNEDWGEKLVEIAFIFNQFDGQVYSREKIENALKSISPRAALAIDARDPSKFRDEISAYPAYLGLYRLEIEEGQWILRLSESAKKFLMTVS